MQCSGKEPFMTYNHLLNTMGEFRVHSYETEHGLVVECHGKLISDHSVQFRDEVRKLIPGRKKIMLDFKGVPQMDSAGLGAVATLYISARTRSCKIQVVHASDQIRKIFSVTNLLLLFEDAGRGGKMM
jgi:anti-anti-sigma factor